MTFQVSRQQPLSGNSLADNDLVASVCPPGLVLAQQDEFWMQQALILARQAESLGEVPVGAVVVKNQRLIGYGFNQSITLNDPSAHAEIMALRMAGQVLTNYRLPDTTLYVTLEPCAMCATTMVHARVGRLVYGAADLKTGAAGSVLNLTDYAVFNHQLSCMSGVLQQDCSSLLSNFFKLRRAQHKAKKVSGSFI